MNPGKAPAAGGLLLFGVLVATFLGAASVAASPEQALLLNDPGFLNGRFGLATAVSPPPMQVGETPSAPAPRGSEVSPFLAGLMSAVLPGTGQLIQGQDRGWIYLGVEVVAWFSFFGLRNAGHQAEEDFAQFAGEHWTWEMYETVSDCGDGLGPVNFQEERDNLLDLFENDLDDFYQTIGRRGAYACGWDTQGNREEFLSMRDDASNLFRASRYMSSAAFVNHLISAVDAARSAAGRRNKTRHSLGWRVAPTRNGSLAFRVALNRSF